MHPYSRSWGRDCTFVHVAGKCIPGRRIYGNIWRWAAEWLRLRLTSPASIALTDRGSRPRFSSTCSLCTTSSRQLIRWIERYLSTLSFSDICTRAKIFGFRGGTCFSRREQCCLGRMFLSHVLIGVVCNSVATRVLVYSLILFFDVRTQLGRRISFFNLTKFVASRTYCGSIEFYAKLQHLQKCYCRRRAKYL